MTAMEQSFVREFQGELRVSSLDVAERTGNEHRAVLQLVNSYVDDFEQFGHLAFEMRDGYQGHKVRVAHLNEAQATLLITFMRNSEVVRRFKVELVRQFQEMKATLTRPAVPQSFAEALELAAVQARQLEVAQPKADAWDELASAEGDYAVADAAKILARAGIETGAQRLFGQLSDMGWIFRGPQGKWRAYQDKVDAGYLTELPQSHHHPRTGELVLDPPQVRVTLRGLERLRVRLGSVAELAYG